VTLSSPLFTVRGASEADVIAIVDLAKEARTEIAQFRGHEHLLEASTVTEQQWATTITSSNNIVLVASSSMSIIGYAMGDIDAKGTICTVSHVFVDPQARQLGIGTRLVGEIARAAKDKGCRTLDAVALPGDRKMKNLYERIGMPARLLIASKTL
jgi:ribosomal protein S18 acetylase RimI-like enzyme